MNVSSIQIQRPGFLDMVQDALPETGADPAQFEFELTEGILLQAWPRSKAVQNASGHGLRAGHR